MRIFLIYFFDLFFHHKNHNIHHLGSILYDKITSDNTAFISGSYDVNATDGNYSIIAETQNKYKGFNNSSAYGGIAVPIGYLENTINSTVNTDSYADIIANGAINVNSKNSVLKEAIKL